MNGQPNGSGTMVYADRSIYVGQFIDSIPMGHGTMNFANGDVYSGQFNDGVANGWGNIVFSNGQRFTGSFKDGQPVNDGIQGDNYLTQLSRENVVPGSQ